MSRFTFYFSHEFEDGQAGPARSYWNIRNAGNKDIGTVCLHHRDVMHPEAQMNAITQLLERAFQAGEAEMQRTIRKAIGL